MNHAEIEFRMVFFMHYFAEINSLSAVETSINDALAASPNLPPTYTSKSFKLIVPSFKSD